MVEETPDPADRLEGRLEFETLIADRSSRFISLPPADVDREIDSALGRVCGHDDDRAGRRLRVHLRSEGADGGARFGGVEDHEDQSVRIHGMSPCLAVGGVSD
jgi:hypothetical protein